jgi:hypothetical protein
MRFNRLQCGEVAVQWVNPSASSRLRERVMLCLIACVALGLGGLVYLLDRDHSRSMLMLAWFAPIHGSWFGSAGLWLPSFSHAFGFSLLTAIALPTRSGWQYVACLGCGLTDLGFELGQHRLIREHLSQELRGSVLPEWIARPLDSYFMRGTFDSADLMASIAGAFTAAMLIYVMTTSLEKHHAA